MIISARLLLSGHDTIECAYYLAPNAGCSLDYERLAVQKEELRLSKSRKPAPIKLGCEEFMLAGHGTKIPAEVVLLESILPEIILAMMQAEELHVDD